MSDFHVLDQAADGKTINVVCHFPVPATVNQAGMSYQTAIVLFQGGAENIRSDVADAEELANLQAGALYEQSVSIRWSKMGLTNAQKLAEIKAAWTAKQAELAIYFPTVLAFEGYKGDV